jgi:hypothetical protein
VNSAIREVKEEIAVVDTSAGLAYGLRRDRIAARVSELDILNRQSIRRNSSPVTLVLEERGPSNES